MSQLLVEVSNGFVAYLFVLQTHAVRIGRLLAVEARWVEKSLPVLGVSVLFVLYY